MNRDKILAGVMVGTFVLTAYNTLVLQSKIDYLSSQVNNQISSVWDSQNSLQNTFYYEFNELKDQLVTDASLLASSEVYSKLEDGQVAVFVEAEPKVSQIGQENFAIVVVDGKRYEAKIVDGVAKVLIPVGAEFKVNVELRSLAKTEVEYLGEYDTFDLVTVHMGSKFHEEPNADGHYNLAVYFDDDMNNMPFKLDDIEKVEYYLVVEPADEAVADVQAEAVKFEYVEFDFLNMLDQTIFNTNMVGEGVYEHLISAKEFYCEDGMANRFYLLVTLKDGRRYASMNNFAHYESSANGKSVSLGSGDFMIYPVLD